VSILPQNMGALAHPTRETKAGNKQWIGAIVIMESNQAKTKLEKSTALAVREEASGAFIARDQRQWEYKINEADCHFTARRYYSEYALHAQEIAASFGCITNPGLAGWLTDNPNLGSLMISRIQPEAINYSGALTLAWWRL
jgi:hypothetical protein